MLGGFSSRWLLGRGVWFRFTGGVVCSYCPYIFRAQVRSLYCSSSFVKYFAAGLLGGGDHFLILCYWGQSTVV